MNRFFKPKEGNLRLSSFLEFSGMQIQCIAEITNALFSEHSPMIYERCTSLWEDNAIWNGPFHKSIPFVPSCIQDYYELLNPIMFSSSIDKKKGTLFGAG